MTKTQFLVEAAIHIKAARLPKCATAWLEAQELWDAMPPEVREEFDKEASAREEERAAQYSANVAVAHGHRQGHG